MNLSIGLFERVFGTQCNEHTAIYRTHVLKATPKHIPRTLKKRRNQPNKEKSNWLEKVSYSFHLYNGTACHACTLFSLSSEHFECVRHTAMLHVTTFKPMCLNVRIAYMYCVYLDEQIHLFHTINCILYTCAAKTEYRIVRMAYVFGSF